MSGILNDSQQAILCYVLRDLEIVDSAEWPIFIDQEPDLPDNCITIYGTLGKDDGRTQIDGELQEHHGVQIRVRSTDRVGFTIITELACACDKLVDKGITLPDSEGGSHYIVQSVNRTGNGVNSLGKEMSPSRRNLYTFNALVNVRMVTS